MVPFSISFVLPLALQMSVVTVQRSFPPGQIQSGDRVSRDRGIFRDVQVRVIGYAAHWCGLCPGGGAAVFVAALLSCCPVVVADVSVISCCRVLPGSVWWPNHHGE
ncbi:hypothetical protein K7G95_14070 [Escherichia coli]|nr:hypothetical protein K7G95_14070 [Escherichia coli]